MTDSLLPMMQSTDLAKALHLCPGFANGVVDYPPWLPAPLADLYRHVKFFDEMLVPDDLMELPRRVEAVESFLAHDYAAALKAALEQPPITEEEISEVAKFIVSGMPLANNMRKEVAMLDAADVIRQGIPSPSGIRYPSLWAVQLARTELLHTAEFYTTKAFREALAKVMEGMQQLRSCLLRLKAKPERTMPRYHEYVQFLEENFKAKCHPGNEPPILTTDPEIANIVHEATGQVTWCAPADRTEGLIDCLMSGILLVGPDERLLNSLAQQYPNRVIEVIPAHADKLRLRKDEFREYVATVIGRSGLRSRPKLLYNKQQ